MDLMVDPTNDFDWTVWLGGVSSPRSWIHVCVTGHEYETYKNIIPSYIPPVSADAKVWATHKPSFDDKPLA